MRPFLHEDFLLNNNTAVHLYHRAAKQMPIFDFHCHLSPEEVWENKPFENMTQIWLAGDHYKWRLMRIHGISEDKITGNASDWEKFEAWAQTVPHLIGNPLHHWTHMELKMFFGIDKFLNLETAREIWEECNAKLQTPEFKPRMFIEKANVQFIGTTDDPVSDLSYHKLLTEDPSFKAQIAPTFRPDGALFLERPTFREWLQKLAEVSGKPTASIDDLLSALQQRIDFFHEQGGRASDHDLPQTIYIEVTKDEAGVIFNKRLNGEEITEDEVLRYRSFLLKELGKMYADKQWVMQLHMGAMRNNNTRMKEKVGPDTGFDSIGNSINAEGLSRFLDALDREGKLPRTVLFNLNPRDNEVLAGMMGNFFEEGVPGKIQFGSAWWFNDHLEGMIKQMKDLSNVGMLTHFIGMLTDSRSLLSYVRHDYFRRILCNLLGEWVEDGKVPEDMPYLEKVVQNIGYNNAKAYFLER
ncbi:MAG TPA: glucuronate isomerase [Chondromyces sp.]|nr:glucuronate isomerase [Chondromyces sp.]